VRRHLLPRDAAAGARAVGCDAAAALSWRRAAAPAHDGNGVAIDSAAPWISDDRRDGGVRRRHAASRSRPHQVARPAWSRWSQSLRGTEMFIVGMALGVMSIDTAMINVGSSVSLCLCD